MRRRDFIRLSTGALAATLAPLSGCARTSEPSPALADPATLGNIADEETIRGIGRAYLAGSRQEAHRDRLVELLLDDESGDRAAPDEAEALRRFLAEKIREDFEADRTVVVDGWILAITEARQAALLSLMP